VTAYGSDDIETALRLAFLIPSISRLVMYLETGTDGDIEMARDIYTGTFESNGIVTGSKLVVRERTSPIFNDVVAEIVSLNDHLKCEQLRRAASFNHNGALKDWSLRSMKIKVRLGLRAKSDLAAYLNDS